VVKYLDEENVQVMHPDGAFSSRNQDLEWTKTSADGSRTAENGKKLDSFRTTTKTDISSMSVTISRVDFVSVTMHPDGKLNTTHADGTNIMKDPLNGLIKINSSDLAPNVTFSSDPKIGKLVEMSEQFKVGRKIVNGDDTITIERVWVN
jgi:hypothetical protein